MSRDSTGVERLGMECVRPQSSYFFRVNLANKASLVVGLPSITSSTQEDVLDAVRTYGKREECLELPDPYEIFDFTLDLGMVSWQEHRRFKKTHPCWPTLGNACIFLESLRTSSPAEIVKHSLPDCSLGRAIQIEIEYSPLQSE